MRKQHGDVVYFADENIAPLHAFTTRLGGASVGTYASLNLGVNLSDDPAAVRENYRRMLQALDSTPDRLVFSRQVHTNTIRTVTGDDCLGDVFTPISHEADGLITNDPGVALLVFVADCIPILLWDPTTGAVGAVHAGWRSTVLDIAGGAVRQMQHAFGTDPTHVRVAIGPGIGRCCFETSAEVPAAVQDMLGDQARGCMTDLENGKSMVDLKEVNRRGLLRAGVLDHCITVCDLCTMCNPDLFWSHRKMGGTRGSQAAIIVRR